MRTLAVMHPAAFQFVERSVETVDHVASVIEIGSRDINGSVRPLFGPVEYTGLDLVAGDGVDVVTSCDAWDPPRFVDAVVCCEVLEHVEDWPSVLATAARYLKGRGWLILTAAGPGRAPHSGITGRKQLELDEFYGNVDPDDLDRALSAAGFDDVEVFICGADVQARARRRIRTTVEIPFLDEPERTLAVAGAALIDPTTDLLILDDNGSTDPDLLAALDGLEVDFAGRVRVNHRETLESGLSLYTVWNEAVLAAQARECGAPANVAILNNDVALAPEAITELARALRRAGPDVAAVYPDTSADAFSRPSGRLTKTEGTWRHGGLTGFGFMAKAELFGPIVPYFDERYRLIYGDGDYVEDLGKAGLTAARVDGLPLGHETSTTLGSGAPWIRRAKSADTRARKAKT